MDRFSDRIGATKPKQIQHDDMDEDLRNTLWNFVYDLYKSEKGFEYWKRVALYMASHHLKKQMDYVPVRDYEARKWINSFFMKMDWYEVYNFIVFIVEHHDRMAIGVFVRSARTINHPKQKRNLIQTLNKILKREFSGFRFISGVLAPITNEVEIKEIESAIKTATEKMIQGASEHLSQALELLGKIPDPDYRNSIKESISAVESVAKQISGVEKAKSLEVPLNELSDKTYIHPALQEGFNRIYGYTSDEDGIRHSITEEESNAGFEEAQFMLVSCSAFVNFLIAKAEKAGLLEEE